MNVRDRKVLAPLLVLVLLVCHGAYGTTAHHLVFEQGAVGGGHASHGELPGGEGAAAGYAAATALLIVMTAVFWLRFASVLARRGVPVPDLLQRPYAPSVLRYPRGPDASLLQVFRL